MSPITLIKIALRALLRNRMRTFLSVLGIVIVHRENRDGRNS